MMTLGKKIYTLRTEKGMTQEQLAERLGVSRQSISKYEYNQSTPELEKIKLLAEIFEVTPDDLINDRIDLPKTDTSEAIFSQTDSISDSTDPVPDFDIHETEKNSPSMESMMEDLTKKTDSLQTQYNHLNKTLKGTFAILILLAAIDIHQAFLINTLQNSQHNTTTYIDSPDYEESLLDQTISSYEYGAKASDYNKADNTIEYYVSCTPFNYSNDTTISALLTSDNGNVYTGILSESNGTFSGTVTLPLTADDFSLNLLIDNQGEKQNLEVENYPINLLNDLDWLPSVSIASAKETYKKSGITTLSGEMYLQTYEPNHVNTILPFISDIKVVFRTGDTVLYEYTLTKEEMENIQEGLGPCISYQFERDNESMEKDLTLSIEYGNSLIGKNLRCEFITTFLSKGDVFTTDGETSYIKIIDGNMAKK